MSAETVAGSIRAVIERLESYYDFQCEGGPLRNCVEWQTLKCLIDAREPVTKKKISAEKIKLIEVGNALGQLAKLAGHPDPDGISWEEGFGFLKQALLAVRDPAVHTEKE